MWNEIRCARNWPSGRSNGSGRARQFTAASSPRQRGWPWKDSADDGQCQNGPATLRMSKPKTICAEFVNARTTVGPSAGKISCAMSKRQQIVSWCHKREAAPEADHSLTIKHNYRFSNSPKRKGTFRLSQISRCDYADCSDRKAANSAVKHREAACDSSLTDCLRGLGNQNVHSLVAAPIFSLLEMVPGAHYF